MDTSDEHQEWILKRDDFEQVNFGIIVADKFGHMFVFQVPMPYSTERHAQTSPCYIIDKNGFVDVEDFDEALKEMNSWIKESVSMSDEIQKMRNSLEEVVSPDCINEWMETPNEAFDGSTPGNVATRGDMHLLWEMIYRLRSGIPG